MEKGDFTRDAPGGVVKASGPSGPYWAYVPNPLPPIGWMPSSSTAKKLGDAALALGELKGIGQMLPNPHLLIGPLLRREAVSSSRIEGTVTSIAQLFLFEADPSNDDMTADREEVANYVRALEYGLERLATLPVSLRLMRELHERLMRGVRGEDKRPGEFRDQQNMIGRHGQTPTEARFVPPPVLHMKDSLDELERFIHHPSGFHDLIDISLIHYQFETIHPFLDGNGRLGRLLITLLLCERGCLTTPLLYLSDYFERYRERYIDLLLDVSREGDWSTWIEFFLDAIARQSRAAVLRCRELLDVWRAYRDETQAKGSSTKTLALLDHLFERPIVTITETQAALQVTFHTARSQIEKLVARGILREITGRSKNRVYAAEEILRVLSKPDEAPG